MQKKISLIGAIVIAASCALYSHFDNASAYTASTDTAYNQKDIKAKKQAKETYKEKIRNEKTETTRRRNFNEAKGQMPAIFRQLNEPKTIYCGCRIDFKKNWYYPDLESCGYVIYTDEKRAKRIEAEHIMPAHEFGSKRQCWNNGGRKNCASSDDEFALMEGDLHNLYPSVGEVNAKRSNFKFSESVNNKKHIFGPKCDMFIDSKRQRAQIPERARGIVARAYLYMASKYSIKLDEEHINLFNQWNKRYLPDSNECKWNELVTNIQGNDNPFITKKCKAAK